MKDLTQTAIKGAFMGIAVGGLTSAVIDANIMVAKALWRFNCLAAETVWVLAKATAEWIVPEDEYEDDEPNES